jgi:hypothetical protein
VVADLDTPRLESLGRKARPLAEAHGVPLRLVNTRETPLMERFSYIAMMVPAAAMVAAAIRDSAQGGLINIFAGIPIGTRQELDLDTYLARGCWMFGTSGSTISDMRLVLDKVEGGRLDTPCSVDAISGLAGAIDGIAALENRSVAGKIVVYPALRELGLIPLADLPRRFPTVAAKLASGLWTKAAEEELLAVAKGD